MTPSPSGEIKRKLRSATALVPENLEFLACWSPASSSPTTSCSLPPDTHTPSPSWLVGRAKRWPLAPSACCHLIPRTQGSSGHSAPLAFVHLLLALVPLLTIANKSTVSCTVSAERVILCFFFLSSFFHSVSQGLARDVCHHRSAPPIGSLTSASHSVCPSVGPWVARVSVSPVCRPVSVCLWACAQLL